MTFTRTVYKTFRQTPFFEVVPFSLKRFSIFIVGIVMILCPWTVSANSISTTNKGYVIDSLTLVVDGDVAPFNQIQPGDTLFLKPGVRQNLLIIHLNGSPDKPVIISNNGGVVIINTDSYYGISIRESRYFRLTGQGSEADFYGIRIERVAGGAGIGVNDMCSDFEIDHVSIENTLLGGLYAKTDPNCSTPSTRDKFTQFNTIIHDNHIAQVGNEGMYIGSTKYFGTTENYNGRDTLLLPSLLDGVRIYNNIVEYSAWDGIQVSSASNDCRIYGNLVLYDSQEGYYSQMSGIMIGGGSKCDCYNNYIGEGKGSGIESHGLGGYRIFNNIIVDAGRSYLPLDSTERKHGIYVSDISVEKDSSVNILFNDIINPKSDGIRFESVVGRNNVLSSNLILNPGSYDVYENDNTSYTGEDAYVMIPGLTADVAQKNNFKSRTIASAGISLTDFKPLIGSPLIDAAATDLMGVTFDYRYAARLNGVKADIGAFEYDHSQDIDTVDLLKNSTAYPNPVRSLLTIRFSSDSATEASLLIYDLSGILLMKEHKAYQPGGNQDIKIQVNNLPNGIYLYSLYCGGNVQSGKFIKIG